MELAPILNEILERQVYLRGRAWFGWQWRLPFMLVSRKQVQGFAENAADHGVYETAKAFKALKPSKR